MVNGLRVNGFIFSSLIDTRRIAKRFCTLEFVILVLYFDKLSMVSQSITSERGYFAFSFVKNVFRNQVLISSIVNRFFANRKR